jgi:hypothetical protein
MTRRESAKASCATAKGHPVLLLALLVLARIPFEPRLRHRLSLPTVASLGKRLPLAPLLLAGNAIVIAVHLDSWAVAEEVGRFLAGGHLRTVDATIALVR